MGDTVIGNERRSGGSQSKWLSAGSAVAAYSFPPRLVPGQIMMPRNPILSINSQRSRFVRRRLGSLYCRSRAVVLRVNGGLAYLTPLPRFDLAPASPGCQPGERFRGASTCQSTLKSTSWRPCRQPVTQCAQICSHSLVAYPKSKTAPGGLAASRSPRSAGTGWELHLYGVQVVAPLLPNAAVPSS